MIWILGTYYIFLTPSFQQRYPALKSCIIHFGIRFHSSISLFWLAYSVFSIRVYCGLRLCPFRPPKLYHVLPPTHCPTPSRTEYWTTYIKHKRSTNPSACARNTTPCRQTHCIIASGSLVISLPDFAGIHLFFVTTNWAILRNEI